MTIRMITGEFLEIQRVNRYRYEVMSRRSPFFSCVDFAFSDNPLLRPGHTYYVTMGHNPGYPQIAKCHREVNGTTLSA